MALLHFLVLYLSSLGLGALWPIEESTQHRWHGLRLYLGFSTLPIVLFLGSVLFRLPLGVVSYFLLITSCVGLVVFIRRNIRLKSFLSNDVFHPIYLFPVVIIFFSLVFYPFAHRPIHWDEFSHWLLMTKQMYFTQVPLSSEFPYSMYARYTPAWPMVLNYTNFILSKSFTEAFTLFPVYLSGMGILGFLYDLLMNRVFLHIDKKKALLLGWGLVVFFELLDIPERMFGASTLIEKPICDAGAFLFLFLFYLTHEDKVRFKHYLTSGLILMLGVLYKKPFMAFAFPVLLGNIYLSLRVPSYHGISKTVRTLGVALVSVLPLFLAMWLWKMMTDQFPVDWDLTSKGEHNSLWQALISPASIQVYQMATLRGLFHIIKYPLNLLSLLGLYWGLRKKIFRPVVTSVLSFCAVYFVGLCWTYATAFGEYERSYLASFKRYMKVMEGPVQLIGITFLVLAIAPVFKDSKKPWVRKLNFSSKTLTILFILVVIGGLVKAVKKNFLPLVNYQPPFVVGRELPILLEVIKRHNLSQPVVQMMAMGDNGGMRTVLKYASLNSSIEPDFKLEDIYTLNPDYQFFKRDNRPYHEVLRSIWSHVDIIWPVRTDQWVNSVLLKLTVGESCSPDLEKHILIRKKDLPELTFTCVDKKDYLPQVNF